MKIFFFFLASVGIALGEQKERIEIARTDRVVEGWMVRVDDRLLPEGEFHEEFGERALSLLRANLIQIRMLVPEPQLSALRKVVIVVDEHPKLNAAQYHPSKDWLVGEGYEPALAKCVHLSKASFFASPAIVFQQQWVTLHELAHAYHDQVLGWDYPCLLYTSPSPRDRG